MSSHTIRIGVLILLYVIHDMGKDIGLPVVADDVSHRGKGSQWGRNLLQVAVDAGNVNIRYVGSWHPRCGDGGTADDTLVLFGDTVQGAVFGCQDGCPNIVGDIGSQTQDALLAHLACLAVLHEG